MGGALPRTPAGSLQGRGRGGIATGRGRRQVPGAAVGVVGVGRHRSERTVGLAPVRGGRRVVDRGTGQGMHELQPTPALDDQAGGRLGRVHVRRLEAEDVPRAVNGGQVGGSRGRHQEESAPRSLWQPHRPPQIRPLDGGGDR